MFDQLRDYLQASNNSQAALSIDFTDDSQSHPVNVELWFSPTEASSYEFLLKMKDFLTGQPEVVSFTPHYVLQLQRETKNYIGCLSSGRYCPSEIEFEGKYEGKNIVEESLRQLIIWKMDITRQKWWSYIEQFHNNCLRNHEDLFTDASQLQHCHQNSLIMAGIKEAALIEQYNASFLGTRKEVDDNTYLLEERQLYIREQISSHPVVLINKQPRKMEAQALQERICKMEGENPTPLCAQASDQLSTSHMLIILAVIVVLFVAVAALYRFYMHIRMRKEIKGEVDKTLEQYYRYIETFEEDGRTKKKVVHSHKSKHLNEEMEEQVVPPGQLVEPQPEELEMRPIPK